MQPSVPVGSPGQMRFSALILLALTLAGCASDHPQLCMISSPNGVVGAYIGDCER